MGKVTEAGGRYREVCGQIDAAAIARDTLDEDEAADMVAACFDSEDAREGIAAFAEKRATVFKGR